MKKAFSLIELIFVIVIVGLLASIAIPKFKNLTTHAKKAGLKSVITSIQSSVDNIHGKWIINDNFKWIGADNQDHSSDFNYTSGYPARLDANNGKLFSYVLKIPITPCSEKKTGCFEQIDNLTYKYYFNPSKYYQFKYFSSKGTFECNNSDASLQKECEENLY